MKKYLVALAPVAAVAAFALAPASALAGSCTGQTLSAAGICSWGGWGDNDQGATGADGTNSSPASHSDNLADPNYVFSFGSNGSGDSQYCVDPTQTSSTSCGTSGVYSPVYFAGYLMNPVTGTCAEGCSHGTQPTDSTLGGFYLGTDATNGDQPTDIGFYK